MRKIFLILLLVLIPSCLLAADASTITSADFGDWSDANCELEVYVPDCGLPINSDAKYVVVIRESKASGGGFIYTSNPPMLPGYWVYRFKVIDKLADVQEIENAYFIIKIDRIYELQKKMKKREIVQEIEEFDGYEIKDE